MRLMAIVVLRLDVRDVKEAVAADREIDEGGLYGRLEIDDLTLVDVTGVVLVAGSLDVQLFEDAVLDDRDTALLGLKTLISISFFMRSLSRTDAVCVSCSVGSRMNRAEVRAWSGNEWLAGGLPPGPGNNLVVSPCVVRGDLGSVSLST